MSGETSVPGTDVRCVCGGLSIGESAGFRTPDHGADGHDDDFDVQPEGCIGDVISVKLDPLAGPFVRVDVTLVHLLPACYSGGDAIAFRVERDGPTEFFCAEIRFRTWSDDTHIATEDVPELWYLIEPMMAEKHPIFGNPGIVIDRDLVHFRLLEGHGPELRDPEKLPVFPRSILEIQDGEARIEHDDERDDKADREKYRGECDDHNHLDEASYA